ncbi:hypothetical protein V2J09_020576, partial [Rumex salicifolius]
SIRRPKLFWVSAGAPLLSVILSTLLVFAFKAQNHASEVLFFMMGLLQIGKLQEGLNPPSWNILYFHGPHLGLVLKTGLVTGVILLTEGIAIGRTFAALKNYKVGGNKEMIAIVNNNAGSKTAVSNIVMATAVMVALLFLMRLFEYTPEFILGAIIVTSSIGLIDLPAAYHIWKVDKFDFLVMLCALFGVVFISVQEGLAIAITRPKTVLLGNVPGSDIYRDTQQYKEALRVPVKGIYPFILHPMRTCLLPGFPAVIAIDTSGISFLYELKRTSESKGLKASTQNLGFVTSKPYYMVLVNPLGEVMHKLQRADMS